MRRKVAFRPQAAIDIQQIGSFVAEASRSEATSRRITEKLEAACLGLAEFPYKGRLQEGSAAGMRVLAVPRLATIVYRVGQGAIEIVAVLYAGRDVEGEMRRR